MSPYDDAKHCKAQWWVDGEAGPRRCVMSPGHHLEPGHPWHWKGFAKWTEEDTTVDRFGDPGRRWTNADGSPGPGRFPAMPAASSEGQRGIRGGLIDSDVLTRFHAKAAEEGRRVVVISERHMRLPTFAPHEVNAEVQRYRPGTAVIIRHCHLVLGHPSWEDLHREVDRALADTLAAPPPSPKGPAT